MAIVLIDTNILVYAHDLGEYDKQAKAIEILRQLAETGKGCLSVQCLAEFFSITTRGKAPMLTTADALRQVEELARAYPVLPLTMPVVLEAARGVRDHQLAYYDAQVWATAKLNQIPLVLSEDLPSRPILEGVGFLNPFVADFTLEGI